MIEKEKRIQHEIEHGKKISQNAEDVWGWSTPAGRLRAQRRADLLVKYGGFNETSILLEIGCGTGLFTQKIYNATKAKITAIDISPELLIEARLKLPEANFITGDAMNLDFADRSFDGVYGSSILHHLDMEESIKENFRVLKQGGKIVFAEPNMINPQIFLQKNIPYIKRKMGDSPDETAIIRWKLAKIMKQIGFTEVKIIPYDFLHPSIPSKLTTLFDKIGKTVEKIPILKEIAGSVIIYGMK